MGSTHNIHIVGRVGRAPQLRFTPDGEAVASFTVAVNEQYTTRKGEIVHQTVWFSVSAWGKTAELCNQYLKKGHLVYVSGRLIYDPKTGGPQIWLDKNKTPKASFSVRATTVIFLQRPNASADAADLEDMPF